MIDTAKPHRGTIQNWGANPPPLLGGLVLGCMVIGELNGSDILTTQIRAQEGDEIETLNNRYTLGVPYPATLKR